MDTSLFDGCGLGILVLVDHVLVGGLVHELLDFGLDPGSAESREVLLGIAVENQLIVDALIYRLRVPAGFGEEVGLGSGIMNACLDFVGGGGVQLFDVVQAHVVFSRFARLAN